MTETATRRAPSPDMIDAATPHLPALHEGREAAPPAPIETKPWVPATLEEHRALHMPKEGFGDLAAAVAAVIAEIKPVEKRGENTFHKYEYARMQDILLELAPLMGKHGIVIWQTEKSKSFFDNGGAVAITYQFTVMHKSGQIWPERPEQTGLANCRTSNGKFDDKCLNKCHTAARKYFLMALFQIATADEDDADADGVAPSRKGTASRGPAPSPDGHVAPHTIDTSAYPGAEGLPAFTEAYIGFIAKAKSREEIAEWDRLNDAALTIVNDRDQTLYFKIIKATDDRGEALKNAAPEPKADPISSGPQGSKPKAAGKVGTGFQRPADAPPAEGDPEEFFAWATAKMKATGSIEDLQALYNDVIEPSAKGMNQIDLNELAGLYGKAEARFEDNADAK